ncbi:MAG TPA: ABC transporter permease [Anaerolineae bacterium]|nr:ABC transporter permease [Anaerolineae bacterium]
MSSLPQPVSPRGGSSMSMANRAVVFGLREAGVGVALVVLILIFSVLSPFFATTDNFTSILAQVSINTILAVGMTFVILIAGIDLSVGSVLALATVVGAKLLVSDLDPLVSIPMTVVACIGVGALCGIFNGFVSEWWRVSSFIVTLGMMSIARGSSQVISNNSTITGMPKVFKDFGNWQIFELVPVYVIIAIVIVLVAWFVLRFTVFGRFIYAIGNNEEAVRLSGHNPMPYKISAFVICGLLAGLAGLVFLLRLKAGSPIAAVGWELTAIAAVIIGGTSFAGGKGSVIGTFFGVALLQVLGTGLILVGVEDNVRTIIIGLVVVAAAVFDTYRSRIISGLRAR